jgi:NAD+ diphosphatase
VTNPRLLDDLLLSRAAIERAAHLRADGEWQRSRMSDAASLVLWVGGSATAVAAGEGTPALLLTPVTDLDDPSNLSFLGVDADGCAYFAAHAEGQAHPALPAATEWASLRAIGGGLSDLHAGLTVTAVALDNWRARTRWCSACGGVLAIGNAGWSLRCEADGVEHFPRTDPAVIVLVRDHDDRALLGRHVNWPAGRMSTFAGFVEAGESAEAAVRRELTEETGVVIGPAPDDVQYLGSQPWPFPCSLMLGYHAWAAQTEITVDGEEIAEAHWFTRAELLAACESGAVTLPSPVSISRKLIERWYGEELPGEW